MFLGGRAFNPAIWTRKQTLPRSHTSQKQRGKWPQRIQAPPDSNARVLSVCAAMLRRKAGGQVSLSIALELGAVFQMLAEIHKAVVRRGGVNTGETTVLPKA